MTIEGRCKAEAEDRFICLDGSGHFVAEDMTAQPEGWEELKAAYRTENPTTAQSAKRYWFEHECRNRDGEGLQNGREHFWSKDHINSRLEKLTKKKI